MWGLCTFTGTASVRVLLWSWSEEEQCSQIPACLLSIICTALHSFSLSDPLSEGLTSVFDFSVCLSNLLHCFHVCTVALMLNQASKQKCSGFASKKFWWVGCWFTETVALWCVSDCPSSPCKTSLWLLTNVGSYCIVSVCWRAGYGQFIARDGKKVERVAKNQLREIFLREVQAYIPHEGLWSCEPFNMLNEMSPV